MKMERNVKLTYSKGQSDLRQKLFNSMIGKIKQNLKRFQD